MLAVLVVRCVGGAGGPLCWRCWWSVVLAVLVVRCVGGAGGPLCWRCWWSVVLAVLVVRCAVAPVSLGPDFRDTLQGRTSPSASADMSGTSLSLYSEYTDSNYFYNSSRLFVDEVN